VENDGQEGIIDLESAVVLDEAKLLEFVHEQIDARAGCANHLRERLLLDFRECALRPRLFTISGKQQKRARQPLLGGVE
jgi:hypothetical protein